MPNRFVIPPSPALEELMRREEEAGFNPLGDPPPPPGPAAPPAKPLVPLVIPPVDWREEEERAATAANQDELERKQPSYPAPKQKKSATPNLDEVRAWRSAS